MSNSNLVISYELVQLLNWLLEKNKPELKKLVNDAMDSGLANNLSALMENYNYNQQNNSSGEEEVYFSVIEFISFLESIVFSSLSSKATKARKFYSSSLKKRHALYRFDTSSDLNSKIAVEALKRSLEIQHAPTEEDESVLSKFLESWRPATIKKECIIN